MTLNILKERRLDGQDSSCTLASVDDGPDEGRGAAECSRKNPVKGLALPRRRILARRIAWFAAAAAMMWILAQWWRAPAELDIKRGDASDELAVLAGSTEPDSNGYVVYLPHSGLHNQRIALENAIAIAVLLNRTLVVPPLILGHPIPWQPGETLRETYGDAERAFRGRLLAAATGPLTGNASLYQASGGALVRWSDVFDLGLVRAQTGVRLVSVGHFIAHIRQFRASAADAVWRFRDTDRRGLALVDALPFANAGLPLDTAQSRVTATPLAPSNCARAYLAGNATLAAAAGSNATRWTAVTAVLCGDSGSLWNDPRVLARHQGTSGLSPAALRAELGDTFAMRTSRFHMHVSHAEGRAVTYRLLISPFQHVLALEGVPTRTRGGPLVVQFGSLFGSKRLVTTLRAQQSLLPEVRAALVPAVPAVARAVSKIQHSLRVSRQRVAVGMHLRTADGAFARQAAHTVSDAALLLERALDTIRRALQWVRPTGRGRSPLELVVYVATDARSPGTSTLLAPLRRVVKAASTGPMVVHLLFLGDLARMGAYDASAFSRELNAYFARRYITHRPLAPFACGPVGMHAALAALDRLPRYSTLALATAARGPRADLVARVTTTPTTRLSRRAEARDLPLLANCSWFPTALGGAPPAINVAKFFNAWLDMMIPVSLAPVFIGTAGSTFSTYMERLWLARQPSAATVSAAATQLLESLLGDDQAPAVQQRLSQLAPSLQREVHSLATSALFASGSSSADASGAAPVDVEDPEAS